MWSDIVRAEHTFCTGLVQAIERQLESGFCFMEVCGTHTMSIYRSGLHSILPEQLTHLAGPGCPVCVTAQSEIEACLELASKPEVMLVSFGDMLKVPGSNGQSLQHLQAEGAQVRVCYAPARALELARQHPQCQVVFLAVGFETTAPAVAATVKKAYAIKQSNFSILSLHKLLPPVLSHLVEDAQSRIEGFILPGHVSAVIGCEPYLFLSRDYHLPGVIAGFEALDILQALYFLVQMHCQGLAEIKNQYTRAVRTRGNPRAREVMQEVFRPRATRWRGLGEIPDSGLELREKYKGFDARELFALTSATKQDEDSLCKCGDILQGKISPGQCPLFRGQCTPASPRGPCMVSSEGSCSAVYHYLQQ